MVIHYYSPSRAVHAAQLVASAFGFTHDKSPSSAHIGNFTQQIAKRDDTVQYFRISMLAQLPHVFIVLVTVILLCRPVSAGFAVSVLDDAISLTPTIPICAADWMLTVRHNDWITTIPLSAVAAPACLLRHCYSPVVLSRRRSGWRRYPYALCWIPPSPT